MKRSRTGGLHLFPPALISCLSWGSPTSRGTPASGNQSPRQTMKEHKRVNDKQMKGRISDTCSLPQLSPPPLPLSPSSLSFLSSNSSLPPHLFYWSLGWLRFWRRWMQELQTQGCSSFFLSCLFFSLLSVPRSALFLSPCSE